MKLSQWDLQKDSNAYPKGPTAEGRSVYRLIGWEGSDRGGLLLSESERDAITAAWRSVPSPATGAGAPDRPATAQPLPKVRFAQLAGWIAKHAAAWSSDSLDLVERDPNMGPQDVFRFTDEMRARLDRLDKQAGRALENKHG